MKTTAALAVLALCVPASAQRFWNDTKAGMTKAQVMTSLGKAIVPEKDKPDSYTLEQPICRADFHISFSFDKNRLASETLTSAALFDDRDSPYYKAASVPIGAFPHDPTGVSGALGACVIEQYTAAYGKPTHVTDRAPIGRSYSFSKLDTIIDIDLLQSTVIVTYRVRNKTL